MIIIPCFFFVLLSYRNLRAGVGGLLRHYEAFNGLPMKHLLPLKTDIPDEGCIREHPDQRCFLAGKSGLGFDYLYVVEGVRLWWCTLCLAVGGE